MDNVGKAAVAEFIGTFALIFFGAGAIIMTGTPHGVGFARTPPVWMKAGDQVAVEIEKIGRLENPVSAEG